MATREEVVMRSASLRAAVEAGDLAAMVETLAPDVVFHGPVISTPFVGREQVGVLFEALLASFEEIRYTGQLASADVEVLAFTARVGKRQVEGMDLLRFDEHGKIREFRVAIRPLSALAAVAGAVGPRLAQRRGRGRAAIVSAFGRTLSAMTALGDSAASRLVDTQGSRDL
jgi:SnoaL-like domain